LIIDHGSNDGTTSSIINEYAQLDARVSVVRTEINYFNDYFAKRIPNALGLYDMVDSNVNTDYVCSLDSDDYFYDNHLEVTIDLAIKNNADTVYFLIVGLIESEIQKRGIIYNTSLYHTGSSPYKQTVAVDEKTKWKWCSATYPSSAWWSALIKRGVFFSCLNSYWSFKDGYNPWDTLLSFMYAEKSEVVVFCDELLYGHTYKRNLYKESNSTKSRKDADAIKMFGFSALSILDCLRTNLDCYGFNADVYASIYGETKLSHVLNSALITLRKSDDREVLSTLFSDLLTLLSDDYIQRLVINNKETLRAIREIVGGLYLIMNF